MNRNQLKKEITCVNECAEFTLVFQTGGKVEHNEK